MQVCPGCHTALPSGQTYPDISSVAPHWPPSTTSFTPGLMHPPYVCGRMFQVTSIPGVRGACPVPSTTDKCIVLPGESCQFVCYLACPHNCHARPFATCSTTSKLTCTVPELRTSLHTSGGGLVEGEKDAYNTRSISPEAKVNYPNSLNPFLSTSSLSLVNKALSDSPSPERRSPSPAEAAESVWTAAGDSRVLLATRNALEESGWYYGALSWQQAAHMLQATEVGTFLIRDSASPQCLYSLSVQTTNGPTSVRIHYAFGKFRLDCTGHSQKLMPEFKGVVELVEHYIHSTSSQVWVDHEGKTFSPINIQKPLRRSAPSLQHLCRLAINCTFPKTSTTCLPPALKSFLNSYPHTC